MAKSIIVPDCKAIILLPIITVELYSDSWRSYAGLVALGYVKHYCINHSQNEFAFKNQDGATVTDIESFCQF